MIVVVYVLINRLDGSTADLMTLFYKNLYQVNTNSTTPANASQGNLVQTQHSTTKQAYALRQAKLTLINDGARVADWAGFVLSGGGGDGLICENVLIYFY